MLVSLDHASVSKAPAYFVFFVFSQIIDLGNGGVSDCLPFNEIERGLESQRSEFVPVSLGKSHFLACWGNLFQSHLEKKIWTLTFPAVTDQRMNCEINLRCRVDISESESNATQKAIGYNCRLHTGTCPGREMRGSAHWGGEFRAWVLRLLFLHPFSPEKEVRSIDAYLSR